MKEISGFPIEGTYEYLRRLFNFNCTHIVGNVVIFGLHQNLSGSDPDLSFLRSIQEISGYLIIMNSSVQEIPLSGLKIIRGLGGGYNIKKDLPFASVVIRHTYTTMRSLKRIDLSSLRVIQNGDVYMFDNPHGNGIISDISWSSLFANPAKQRFHNSSSVDVTLSDVPHIEMVTQGRCRKRSCEWCFSQSGGEERCCDAECLGGCTGPSPSDCLVCKNYRDGDTCVHRCPPPLFLQNYRLALNVNFKYEFAGFCVEECPKSLMAEGPRCVWECSPGQYTAAGNVCVPCGKNCPKVCSLGTAQFSDASSLDATALASLRNCTKLSGNLIISDDSYSSNGAHWKPITTSKELWALHSLREVTGYVHLNLQKHPAPLNNLTFLENLEKIGGSHARYSMSVVHNAIQFPGLYSLMEAPQGDVVFMESPELCYVQTIVTAKTVDQNLFLPRLKISWYQLPTAEQCRSRNAVCHPACDPAYGCWGPRREDCIRCRNRSIDGSICVESCYDLPGYYDAPEESMLAPPPIQSRNDNPMTARLVLARLAADHAIEEATHTRFAEALERRKANITCSRCHSECAETCTGPGADQCVGECKNSKSSNECVSECQHTSYLEKESRICTPCQTHCHQRLVSKKPVCTGPGHYPGPGGCNKCEKFLEFITFDGVSLGESSRTQHGALLCMRGACPEGTFSTFEAVEPSSKFAPFVEEGVNAVPVCRSCHHLCSSCTGYSAIRANAKSPGCLECKGFWFNDTCVTECPEDSTFQISLTHPPETRKAYHFMQSIDQRGLLLSKKLPSPVKGAGEFPRPKIWSRHLDGRCLVCHEECRGGCWGPSNSHCHRCAHFRVWNRDEQAEPEELARDMWRVPEGGNVYQLNKDVSNRPLSQTLDYPMHFSCELTCPPGLPYASVDPLTGDRTCHLSPELNSLYTGRENASSSRLGVSLVGPIAVALVMFAVCVSIACYCKRRQSLHKFHFERKTVISRVSGMFDGLLRSCVGLKSEQNYCMVPVPAALNDFGACQCGGNSDDRGMSLYAVSNRITWSSEGSICQYCRSSFEKPKTPPAALVYRNNYFCNPVYRRSTRQQPNMGRLVLINLDDIQMPANQRALGSGAFGAVYKGVWKMPDDVDGSQLLTADNQDKRRHVDVAIKILNESSGSSDLQALLEEAKVMCSVRHKNCLQLLGVCLAGSQRYLVSEYIANGSLDCYIRRSKNDLPNHLMLLWADQIADGMAYLQSAGIIHRDLATRNVLVKERDLVQITDFGLAKMLSDEEEHGEVIVQSGRVPIRWLAIETLNGGRYSFKTDIWAYGVTLWEIFTFGQRPYPTIETKDIKRYVTTGGRLSQPDICTLEAYQKLLLACWRENPDERVSFTDILQLLRGKAGTPEFFLHCRPTSSISGQTRESRISGAYSEVARPERGSSSPPVASSTPPTTTTTVPSSPSRRSFYVFPATNACQQRSAVLRRITPRAPTTGGETLETLSTTIEYTTTTNSSEDVTLANEQPDVPVGGGYVWPMPVAAPEYPDIAASMLGAAGGGEYVGPLFRRPTAGM